MFPTLRGISLPIDAPNDAVRELETAMRLIAATSRTAAGYHAIKDAARIVFHNQHAGEPDSERLRYRILNDVELFMREYVAMGGIAPIAGDEAG